MFSAFLISRIRSTVFRGRFCYILAKLSYFVFDFLIQQNLDGFNKESGAEEEDVDSGMADVTAVDETNNKAETPTESNNESSQIQILDMSTWSSPPHSPVRMSQPTPFTISKQISQDEDDRGK